MPPAPVDPNNAAILSAAATARDEKLKQRKVQKENRVTISYPPQRY